jgi:hypothetical protein
MKKIFLALAMLAYSLVPAHAAGEDAEVAIICEVKDTVYGFNPGEEPIFSVTPEIDGTSTYRHLFDLWGVELTHSPKGRKNAWTRWKAFRIGQNQYTRSFFWRSSGRNAGTFTVDGDTGKCHKK